MPRKKLYDQYVSISELTTLLSITKVDPNENDRGRNGLHGAVNCHIDQQKRVSMLMEYGTDVNSRNYADSGWNSTPLHTVIAQEVPENSIHFIEAAKRYNRKINYHIQDNQGKTTFLLAVKLRQTSVALHMIKEKLSGEDIDLDAPDEDGMTPINYACAYGDQEVVVALVHADVDFNAVDINGRKPIDYTTADKESILASLKSVDIDGNRDENARFNRPHDKNFICIANLKRSRCEIRAIKQNKKQVKKFLSKGVIDCNVDFIHEKIQPLPKADHDWILTQFDTMTGRTLVEKCMAEQVNVREWLTKQKPREQCSAIYSQSPNLYTRHLLLFDISKHVHSPVLPQGGVKGFSRHRSLLFEATSPSWDNIRVSEKGAVMVTKSVN